MKFQYASWEDLIGHIVDFDLLLLCLTFNIEVSQDFLFSNLFLTKSVIFWTKITQTSSDWLGSWILNSSPNSCITPSQISFQLITGESCNSLKSKVNIGFFCWLKRCTACLRKIAYSANCCSSVSEIFEHTLWKSCSLDWYKPSVFVPRSKWLLVQLLEGPMALRIASTALEVLVSPCAGKPQLSGPAVNSTFLLHSSFWRLRSSIIMAMFFVMKNQGRNEVLAPSP